MSADTVLRLNPADVDPSPFNRPTPLAKLEPLMDNIRLHGQLQPGLVRQHTALPGRYECICGHRRLASQRNLGGLFLAILHEGPLSDADIIRLQLTENLQREDMTPFEVADAVRQFIVKQGCRQGEAASLLGIDESVVSKAMTIDANLIEELRPLVASGKLKASKCYIIATLPPEKQREVNPDMKRDQLAKLAKGLKGGKEKKQKLLKHTDGPCSVTVDTNWPGEQIAEWLKARWEAAKDWVRKGVPPEKWGAL